MNPVKVKQKEGNQYLSRCYNKIAVAVLPGGHLRGYTSDKRDEILVPPALLPGEALPGPPVHLNSPPLPPHGSAPSTTTGGELNGIMILREMASKSRFSLPALKLMLLCSDFHFHLWRIYQSLPPLNSIRSCTIASAPGRCFPAHFYWHQKSDRFRFHPLQQIVEGF